MVPTYLQMMCAWMSQFQAASGGVSATSKPGTDGAPPPPPPPAGKDGAGVDSAAGALGLGLDANTGLMPTMDLQTLQSAAAMWQMMSAGNSYPSPPLLAYHGIVYEYLSSRTCVVLLGGRGLMFEDDRWLVA